MRTNQLSVTCDYNCILAMLFGSSTNGRLEVTQFLVTTTSGTVSVNRRDRCIVQHVRAENTRLVCSLDLPMPHRYMFFWFCSGFSWRSFFRYSVFHIRTDEELCLLVYFRETIPAWLMSLAKELYILTGKETRQLFSSYVCVPHSQA